MYFEFHFLIIFFYHGVDFVRITQLIKYVAKIIKNIKTRMQGYRNLGTTP